MTSTRPSEGTGSTPDNGTGDQPPVVARAPGRVNLIGEHTDYNGGLALPVAIDLATVVRFVADASSRLRLTTSSEGAAAVIAVDLPADPEEIARFTPRWARLAASMVATVRPRHGGGLSITSNLPSNAGLSSSAALCVALALALGWSSASGRQTSADPIKPGEPLAVADLCRRAEELWGSKVGLMDPLVSLVGREGSAIMIDFSGPAWEPVTIPAQADLVVVHSGEDRLLAATPYRLRRQECEAASKVLGVPLGQAGEDDLRIIADGSLRRRARHVVTECTRVRQLARALRDCDLVAAGDILSESHRSMAVDFAASTPTVDALVARLSSTPGVHGARMTGGGFGGCVVALTERGAVDPDLWPERVWRVVPSAGASVGPVLTEARARPSP